MRNIYPVIVFIFAICACNERRENTNKTIVSDSTISAETKEKPATNSDSLSIIPGKAIGKLTLDEDAAALTQKLGKPDLSDAAMGKAWSSWIAKATDTHGKLPELNVFTTYKDSNMAQKTVQLIRTSSPDFTTPNHIHVYDSLVAIQKTFTLKLAGVFRHQKRKNNISIYDSPADGIAFEITSNDNVCVAIIIHPKNINVLDHYLNYLLSKGFTQLLSD